MHEKEYIHVQVDTGFTSYGINNGWLDIDREFIRVSVVPLLVESI
jgi:hypothetical protein